ncbi:DNA oxidative demethylase AlkB [Bradyrhizobium viridifuturi]|nr:MULTISPECIES: DNA oxidative demethylase AlkB [Bradyrhizobium]ERF81166.1 MAG: alkylated DNA repair protein AlkB [Bradyrhizobium sp. DFCI-1]OYU58466.1 MAG: alpha-ketoglutarate-dependent dioxygenase AlkB [Bradyrhizobium sp. PARBB1]PSO26064.1 DNA oxidative demethylase AlkB [Bradyrhizobium sp. MOS004]QRI71713.1 DNA oxidative demethylase AlkB [Bradyrhizobium sp. PSBB068]MBR1024497.1 DNA oxidative demethylase AlkB [Bradyrhizobium viridifuturi]
MAADLFESIGDARPPRETIADGAVLLRGFVRPFEAELIPALRAIVKQAPFRHLITPGGHRMSVAMTNCGSVGWVSDPSGYRYDPIDPDTGLNWPVMPEVLRRLAAAAADEAGFTGFTPEACLINRYVPGAKLSLHQDKDELDYGAPIVSISLGLPATFLFGGLKRSDTPRRYRLEHGDVAVWGGPSRLFYHGVAPLADGEHGVLGRQRINLTFRKVR